MINLSIIIPVYKAEQYIERCVRSLMNQTMKENIEFIFINDCTPDASMIILRKIINEFPQRKKQILIIENETNMGVSATRKIGIEAAQGQYIGWCDSDDWVEPDMYLKLYKATKDGLNDIVVCDFLLEYGQFNEKLKMHVSHTPQECIEKMWMGHYFQGSLCAQIIKKHLIKIGFDSIISVDYAEDVYALLFAYYHSQTIAYVQEYLYHYDKSNEVSLTHQINYSKDAWKAQESNLNLLTQTFYNSGGKSRYHITCNALKYNFKNFYKSAFSDIYEFYYTFPECYKDINSFLFTPSKPLINRVKTYLSFNIFFLFLILHSKEFFHKT